MAQARSWGMFNDDDDEKRDDEGYKWLVFEQFVDKTPTSIRFPINSLSVIWIIRMKTIKTYLL